MSRAYLLAIAVAIAAAPLAYAHTDGGVAGTPKTYCEDVKGDSQTHDYGPPGMDLVIALPFDASIPPCPYNSQWDGHYEWAAGGAWLLACSIACGPSGNGGGANVCWGTYADHEWNSHIWAFDAVYGPLGIPVDFAVGADLLDNVPAMDPTEPNCGDFESDTSGHCRDSCEVPWAPGLDGSYQVYVCIPLAQGHVWTATSSTGFMEWPAGCTFSCRDWLRPLSINLRDDLDSRPQC